VQEVTVSIVSHHHGSLVKSLLSQLTKCTKHVARIIITNNVPGDISLNSADFPFEIIQIENDVPQGFGANHTQAFLRCDTEFFCVMNPDITVANDPFAGLLSCRDIQSPAIIAPLIIDPNGSVEDSARYFPTPWGLVKKAFGEYDGVYPLSMDQTVGYPDWVAGMFMLVKSDIYLELDGFDESFFLYYEDVDFCVRVWKSGYAVALCQQVRVTHDARRSSHKDITFLKWHAKSAALFFLKHLGRFPRRIP